ncbi:carbon-nitrogen hydrolase family protein [Siminovitchia fortis]|uniref:Carbon-nitrogen hydrolase family protein n=1 Tax=Siminovitchia fortis TaxID=254758 RepID=A0A443IN74_9BACI|nr:carbon-nitrogen hydrolase family protein [Siminovitchia fortis]RWR06937.1 carbon-nitrogen hydrolase family protein [Siminovitchia fortis]WHY82097.1 carbon-nitrogen hydrolase family protein [Siminovitchia fortis]
MTKWKLAVVQDDFNGGANLRLMESYIIDCMQKHPETKLILFPEAAAAGYIFSEEHVRSKAEPADGPSCRFLSGLAKRFDLYIGYGLIEKKDDKLFNSLNLISPEGELLATYQKMHLTPLEKHLFSAGNRLVTVKTKLGTFGLMICWDMAFPELARLLEKQGTDVILAPSAWESPYEGAYDRMASARAMDNTVYLATCNFTGGDGDVQFFGKSAIYGPDGAVISEKLTGESSIVPAEIDIKKRQELKESFYSMRSDERTDLYTIQWRGERYGS